MTPTWAELVREHCRQALHLGCFAASTYADEYNASHGEAALFSGGFSLER